MTNTKPPKAPSHISPAIREDLAKLGPDKAARARDVADQPRTYPLQEQQ